MSDKNNVKTRQVVTAHPSSLKHSNSNAIEKSGFWAKLTRSWPIMISLVLTATWISFCTYLAFNASFDLPNLSLIELSTLCSGAVLPLILVWLTCLVIVRINPLNDNYRALESGLDQLLQPVEMTQERIVKIIDNLKTEIEKIEAAGDVASSRFKNLEDSFKNQISELFKATVDAEEKSVSIKNNLAFEREAISSATKEIEKYSEQISSQFKQYRDYSLTANEEAKKHSEFLNNEIIFQNKTLDDRSNKIEENLGSLGTRLTKISDEISEQSNHSYHHLSEVIDGFDERKAVLNNFMTNMMDEVNSVCEKLEKQAITINELSDKSSKTGEKITDNLKKQSEELSIIADKTLNDLNASSEAIEQQTKSMGQSIEDASDHSKINIAEASDYFKEKANDMNRVSGDLEAAIKHSFDEIADTITDKAASLGENISIQFQNIEADIDKGNSDLNALLGDNIDGLSALINKNSTETEALLSEVLITINDKSEHIEKSLSDTRINMIDRTTLIQDEYKSLESYAESFQSKMIQTEEELRLQHTNMLSCITIIDDGLTVSIDKIKNNSTSLGTHAQKVIESIISQTSELTNQIAEVQNRSRNSIVEIQNASQQANDNLLNREKETTEVISEWLAAATHVGSEHSESMKKLESLMAELSTLEKTTKKTLLNSEDNIKRISSELLRSTDSIQIASNSAVDAVEETNKAIDKNAEKYQQMINAIQLSSQSLAANANAIESRLKRINSHKFSDVSTQILEKLRSEAVDISQYLEGDIPKELWDNYLDGDKHMFIRKLKKYVGKNVNRQIRTSYSESTEFRENVDNFVKIFEELLATFNETTDTVYSETLITSDIGKIYFALAEATGRLE